MRDCFGKRALLFTTKSMIWRRRKRKRKTQTKHKCKNATALHNSLVCIEFWHKFLSLVLPNLCCLFYFSSIYLNLKMFPFCFLLLILSCLYILCLLIFFIKYIWFIINFRFNLAALRIFANLRI